MTASSQLFSCHQHHPIVSWLCNLNKDCIDPLHLRQFINQYMNDATCSKAIPDTLTDFMQEYVFYKMDLIKSESSAKSFRDTDSKSYQKLTLEDGFAMMAFKKCVLDKPLFLKDFIRVMQEYNYLGNSSEDARKRMDTYALLFFREDMHEFCQSSTVRHNWRKQAPQELQFVEKLVLEYLVAVHQRNLCIKNRNKMKINKTLPKCLRRSAQMLHLTGTIWRMTFGLLSREELCSTKAQLALKRLFASFLAEAKSSMPATSVDLARLGVEIVYETRNIGGLADLFSDFTLNNSLVYKTSTSCVEERSPAVLPKEAVLYAVSAVGFLIGSAADLYSFQMPRCGLDAAGLKLLSNPVHNISDNYIQMLNLSGNPIGDDGMSRLQRFLVKASRLTYLDLSDCGLHEAGAKILSNVLICFPLLYLNLAANDIKHSGVCHIASNLKYVPTLEWLSLADNSLLDYSIISLSESLPLLPNLYGLDLSGNHVTDRGLESLSRSLPQSLSHLRLCRNQIAEGGARLLAPVLAHSRSLHLVDVSENCISDVGVNALVNAATVATAAQSVKAAMSPSATLTPTAMLAATAMLLMSSVNCRQISSVYEGVHSGSDYLADVCVIVHPQNNPKLSFVQQFTRRPSRRSLGHVKSRMKSSTESTDLLPFKSGDGGIAEYENFSFDEKIKPGLNVSPRKYLFGPSEGQCSSDKGLLLTKDGISLPSNGQVHGDDQFIRSESEYSTNAAHYLEGHHLSKHGQCLPKEIQSSPKDGMTNPGQTADAGCLPNLSLISNTCTLDSSGMRYTLSDMSDDVWSGDWDDSDVGECSSSRTLEVFHRAYASPVRLPRVSLADQQPSRHQRVSSHDGFEAACEQHGVGGFIEVEAVDKGEKIEVDGGFGRIGEEEGLRESGESLGKRRSNCGSDRRTIKSLTAVNSVRRCWDELTSSYN